MAKRAVATFGIHADDKTKRGTKSAQKNFRNVDRSVLDLKKSIIGLAAGYATLETAQAVVSASMSAARFKDVETAYKNLATAAGVDYVNALKDMSAATNDTITELELMQKFNTAVMLGLPVERFADMMTIARSAALASGQDMNFMLNSIVTGLGRQSRLMLDNLGIIVSAKEANELYAASIGVTVGQLTEEQRKLAFVNLTLEKGLENVEKAGGAAQSAVDPFNQVRTELQEMQRIMGEMTREDISAWATALSAALSRVNEHFKENGETWMWFLKWWEKSAQAFQNPVKFWGDAVKSLTWDVYQAQLANEEYLRTFEMDAQKAAFVDWIDDVAADVRYIADAPAPEFFDFAEAFGQMGDLPQMEFPSLGGIVPDEEEIVRLREFSALLDEGDELRQSLSTDQQLYNMELQRYNELLDAGVITAETYNAAVASLNVTTGELTDNQIMAGQVFDSVWGSMLDGPEAMGKAMKRLGISLAGAAIKKMILDKMVSGAGASTKAVEAVAGYHAATSMIPFFGPGIAMANIAKMYADMAVAKGAGLAAAAEGSSYAYGPTLVGERGAEVVDFRTPGTVTPNHAIGGGGGGGVTIVIQGDFIADDTTKDNLAREMAERMNALGVA